MRSIAMWARASLVRRFTDTNEYGTGCVNISKKVAAKYHVCCSAAYRTRASELTAVFLAAPDAGE